MVGGLIPRILPRARVSLTHPVSCSFIFYIVSDHKQMPGNEDRFLVLIYPCSQAPLFWNVNTEVVQAGRAWHFFSHELMLMVEREQRDLNCVGVPEDSEQQKERR